METDEVPIEVQHSRNGGDHLLLELQIGYLQIVLLHPDVPAVHRRSESLQQVLRHLKVEIAGGKGIQREKQAVDFGVLAGISQLGVQTEIKVLLILRLISAAGLNQRGRAGQNGVALRNARVLENGQQGKR